MNKSASLTTVRHSALSLDPRSSRRSLSVSTPPVHPLISHASTTASLRDDAEVNEQPSLYRGRSVSVANTDLLAPS